MEHLRMHLVGIDPGANQEKTNIGGNIHFTIGQVCFPEEGWYDLVSVDLKLWLPTIISFALNHTDSCALNLMDGPCQVKLSRDRSGTVTVICIYDGRVEIPKTEIDPAVWNESVVKTIRKYNRLLHEQGLVAQFENELSMLKEVISCN